MSQRYRPAPDRTHHAGRTPVLITLSCGCKTRGRTVPRENAYMVCTSGLMHGYKLRWVSAVEENGFTRINQQYPPEGES